MAPNAVLPSVLYCAFRHFAIEILHRINKFDTAFAVATRLPCCICCESPALTLDFSPDTTPTLER